MTVDETRELRLHRSYNFDGRERYTGDYREHRIEILHVEHGRWSAWIDESSPGEYPNLERARWDVKRVIDYAARKPREAKQS
jgi:hypothetical protein